MLVQSKSLDIFVLLKLALQDSPRPYAELARDLGMSASEVHAAVKRSIQAGLVDPDSRLPRKKALEEYLLHGVRYAFPAPRGPVVRGVPTSYAVSPLAEEFPSSDDLIPVWPDPEGSVRGYAIEPLHSSVPSAARRDPALYELLALVDALREGRARERKLAEQALRNRLIHVHAT
jgi:hypothetical protein